MSMNLGPKDLLYKPVVDALGETVGTVVNMTQNGSGNFEVFGIVMDPEASVRANHGHQRMCEPVFFDIDLIEAVDRVVRLRKKLDELFEE
jgi:hypothetical protein